MFTENKYSLVNNETGEVVPVSVLIKKFESRGRWEAAGIEMLCDYVGLAGNVQSKFLAFVLKTKNADNLLIGSNQKLSDLSGVGLSTVKKVKAKLIKTGLLKKVQTGVHIVNPDMLCYGKETLRRVVMHIWENC